jgi:hypothetical protein
VDRGAHPSGEFVVPVVLFAAGDLGEFGKILRHRRIEFVLQQRDQELADSIAGEGVVGVSRVFAPRLVDVVDVLLEFESAEREEWAENLTAKFAVVVFDGDARVNAGESFEAGSADEAHENGLGLVVEGVCGEDFVDGMSFDEKTVEKSIAEFAGGSFEADVLCGGVLRDFVTVTVKFQVVRAGEVGDELVVGVGFEAAKLVVEMDYREDDAELGAEFQKQAEEGDGIEASGDSDADAVAGVEEVVAADVGQNALGERRHRNMVQQWCSPPGVRPLGQPRRLPLRD